MSLRVNPGTRPGTEGLPVADQAAPRLQRAPGWAAGYSLRLAITDTLAVAVAVFGAQFTRFGLSSTDVDQIDASVGLELSYVSLSVVLVVAWVAFLAMFRTRDRRILGRGSAEFLRIWSATFWLFGFVAIAAFLTTFAFARGFILLAFPLGLILLLASRALWRRWLAR